MSENNEPSKISGNSQDPLTAAALHEGVSRIDDRYVGRSQYDLSHFRYAVSVALEYGLYKPIAFSPAVRRLAGLRLGCYL
jgi:hypothetical protein